MTTRVTPRRGLRGLYVASAATLALLGPAAAEEIVSLGGETLSTPELDPEFRRLQEGLLAEATAARDGAPGEAEAWIWVGRRQGYLARYADAIETFSEGLERFPRDARFLRHRGHRRITQRRLDEAIADLERAAGWVDGLPDEVEPDGLPNARGIPTSTLQTNIWYHLGLARYLLGDWTGAASAYTRCRDLSGNPDMLVAATYWLYLSLRRAGDDAAAAEALSRVGEGLEILENDGYYELLLTFARREEGGELLAAAGAEKASIGYPTTGYGLGAWALLNGNEARAFEIFEAIVASPAVAAFGYIAAEAELARRPAER